MASPRAIFHFGSEALNAKTTVVKVTAIQLEGESTIFKFPTNKQLKEHHPKLLDTNIVKNVVKSMKTRGKFWNVRITLENGLEVEYIDEEGNVCFNDDYLDELQTYIAPEQSLQPQPITNKPLHSVMKNMVLEKFSGKSQNA